MRKPKSKTPSQLRALLAFHRIKVSEVASRCGFSGAYVSQLLHERRRGCRGALDTVRAAVAGFVEERKAGE